MDFEAFFQFFQKNQKNFAKKDFWCKNIDFYEELTPTVEKWPTLDVFCSKKWSTLSIEKGRIDDFMHRRFLIRCLFFRITFCRTKKLAKYFGFKNNLFSKCWNIERHGTVKVFCDNEIRTFSDIFFRSLFNRPHRTYSNPIWHHWLMKAEKLQDIFFDKRTERNSGDTK